MKINKTKNNHETIEFKKYLFRKLTFNFVPSLAFGMSTGSFIHSNYIATGLLKELIVPMLSMFIVYYIVLLPIILLSPKSTWKKIRKEYENL